MLILLLLFTLEIAALYLLSRSLNQSLFTLLYRLTHSQHAAVAGTTFILFPGTVVHELSHLFVAEIVGVKTGKLNLVPERIDSHHVQAGSVEVAKTDPFRRVLIGLAPVFVGTLVITLLSTQLTILFPQIIQIINHPTILPLNNPTLYLFLLYGYLLFAISNNMFSSKEDLDGALPVLLFLVIAITAGYGIGIRLSLHPAIVSTVLFVLKSVTTNLGVVLGINIFFLSIFKSLLWIGKNEYRM